MIERREITLNRFRQLAEPFTCKQRRVEGECSHRKQWCQECGYITIECALSEKLEGKSLCPLCAHAYELNIFTPPDHEAATCKLCTH